MQSSVLSAAHWATNRNIYVEKDPRTPPVSYDENPVATMALLVTDTPSPNADLSIRSHSTSAGAIFTTKSRVTCVMAVNCATSHISPFS